MKATNFRIGNYLNDREGRLCKVESILFDKEDGYTVKAPAIAGPTTSLPNQPIMLTKEWLIKFGFVNGEKNNFSFTKNMQLRIIGYESDYNGIWFGELQHVHQLQNLYFALTGEELTLKQT